MATTKNAVYQVDNGTDFDTIYFETMASLVKTNSGSDVETQLAEKASKRTYLANANGWEKDPDTGLIEQWIKVFTTGINANTPTTFVFNFPVAFVSEVYSVIVTDRGSSSGALISGLRVESNTLSSVTIKVNVPSYVDWVNLYIRAKGK